MNIRLLKQEMMQSSPVSVIIRIKVIGGKLCLQNKDMRLF